MSNKVKTTKMNQNKQKLVPELRFPEFKDDGEWKRLKFSEICKFVRGPFGGSLKKDIFVQSGYAVYEQSHAIHKNFSSFRYYITEKKYKELKRFSVLPNDIIMSCSGTMGKYAIIPKDSKEGVINQALLKLTVKENHNLRFVKSVLELPIIQENLLSQSAGGAIKNVVSVGQIKEMELYIPQPKEQQKIADCLSSIDDLITAESEKLESIKNHKKGLMQNLFPSEGKTTPNFRFPEFKDDGDWEIKPLEVVCDILNNKRQPISGSDRNSGDYPYYGASGIVDYVDNYIFDERLLLVGEDGAKWGSSERTAFIADGKYWVNNHAHVLRTRSIADTMLEGYLVMIDLSPFVTGAAPPKLTLGKLKKIPIPVPKSPKEQQKIADCLSSIDDLITSQGQKIEALKTHKKGLMQQLFPNINEVSV